MSRSHPTSLPLLNFLWLLLHISGSHISYFSSNFLNTAQCLWLSLKSSFSVRSSLQWSFVQMRLNFSTVKHAWNDWIMCGWELTCKKRYKRYNYVRKWQHLIENKGGNKYHSKSILFQIRVKRMIKLSYIFFLMKLVIEGINICCITNRVI